MNNFQLAVLYNVRLMLDVIGRARTDADRAALLASLGWNQSVLAHLHPDLNSDLETGFDAISSAYDRIQSLFDDSLPDYSRIGNALGVLADVYSAVRVLGRDGSVVSIGSEDVRAQVRGIGVDLVEFSFANFLRLYTGSWYPVFVLLGLVELYDASDLTESGETLRQRCRYRRLRPHVLSEFFSDPYQHLLDEYGFSLPYDVNSISHKLLPRLCFVLQRLGISADVDESGRGHVFVGNDDSTSGFGFDFELVAVDGIIAVRFSPDRSLSGHSALSLVLGAWNLRFAFSDLGEVVVSAQGISNRGICPRVELEISSTAPVSSEPIVRIGSWNSTRLEIGTFGTKGVFAPTHEAIELDVELTAAAGRIVIVSGDGDSFLRNILPPEGLQANFDLGVGWSDHNGFYFKGSAGLEATLPLHASIGPVLLESVRIGLHVETEGDPGLQFELSASGSVELGPLTVAVDRVGLGATLGFHDGNLGPVDLDLDFKPPSGLGLVVDAGPVTGGGQLSFDNANGRYTGILQLQIFKVSVTAIGFIETRIPDHADEFSFLIVITAEFPPLQLGLGFTLNGLGGLIGMNRTVSLEALRDGVRGHTVEDLLFPQDPIRNASRLLGGLQRLFPAQEGRFLVGPMARFGWGTPTLVEAELGLLLELPELRLILLGELSLELPTRGEEAVAVFHLSVMGLLDPGQKLLELAASLHDSRILTFPVAGDMALKLSWGEPPIFLFSLGGFHPRFQPPPNFPTLRRLSIALDLDSSLRLGLEAYFALTSNTLQLGARATLTVDVGVVALHGLLYFDALVTFSPFGFRIDFGAMLDVRSGSSSLAAVRVEGVIEGPSPWRVQGKASISILFFELSVDFDVRFGAPPPRTELPTADPAPRLREALQVLGNWASEFAPGVERFVSFGEPARPSGGTEPALILFDPAGGVAVRQKAVPLGRPLARLGEARVEGAPVFVIGGVRLGTTDLVQGPTGYESTEDWFAPAQYAVLSDAERLSLPSFVRMAAGVALGVDRVSVGTSTTRDLAYETVIIPEVGPPATPRAPYRPDEHCLVADLARSASGKARRTVAGLDGYAPPPAEPPALSLTEERYVVASTNGLEVVAGITEPTDDVLARQRLAAHLAAHPADRGRLQVVSLYELGGPS